MAHRMKRKVHTWSSSTAGGEIEEVFDNPRGLQLSKPPQISSESLPMHLLPCWVQDQKFLPQPFHAASCALSAKASLSEPLVQHWVTPASRELPSGFKTSLYTHKHTSLHSCFQALLSPAIEQHSGQLPDAPQVWGSTAGWDEPFPTLFPKVGRGSHLPLRNQTHEPLSCCPPPSSQRDLGQPPCPAIPSHPHSLWPQWPYL